MNTQDPTNIQTEPRFFVLFKGPSGAGKSVAAFSFPNPVVFDYDGKMPAIALKHFPKKSIEYQQFENTSQVYDVMNSWLECPNCGHGKKCIKCSTKCPYETIIHDSYTNAMQLSDSSLADIKEDTFPDVIKRLYVAKSGKKQIDLTDWDYYKIGVKFSDYIVLASKHLFMREGNPKHVIFTAHVVDIKQPDLERGITQRVRRIVAHGETVAEWVPTKFDEVYSFAFREVGGLGIGNTNESYMKHIVLTQTIGQDSAKTAFKLPREIDFTDREYSGKVGFYDIIMNKFRGDSFIGS
jgi:AAA domain